MVETGVSRFLLNDQDRSHSRVRASFAKDRGDMREAYKLGEERKKIDISWLPLVGTAEDRTYRIQYCGVFLRYFPPDRGNHSPAGSLTGAIVYIVIAAEFRFTTSNRFKRNSMAFFGFNR
jgi:hypothetical protein